MAYKGPLTNLSKRGSFDESLSIEMKRFYRCHTEFAVCLIDLNSFKKINDTYGHLKGDEILKQFANILKENSHMTDLVSRWGGDEFSVILPFT